jgi:hypothetical protein
VARAEAAIHKGVGDGGKQVGSADQEGDYDIDPVDGLIQGEQTGALGAQAMRNGRGTRTALKMISVKSQEGL